MDYEKIGLKCGIEIHRRLNTEKKLFCDCRARFSEEKPIGGITRELRTVTGELGDIDAAALHEVKKGMTFLYKIYDKETCLVETDSEPPHPVNKNALELSLKIAIMLNAEIPEEIHFMRKTVIDGSNTSGFQRTAITGLKGKLKTSFGDVGIDNISLEEESAQILGKKEGKIVFGLDRLGIPLIELGTSADMKTPGQAREVAEKIGNLLKAGNMSQRGIGSIRQDVNVSIKRGARVELKGVQDIKMLPKTIDEEIKRQLELMKKGKKVKKEVRRVLPDGKSEFMRPMPGAARMYPETDVPPTVITKEMLSGLELPELLEDKVKRFVNAGLNQELANQIIGSDYLDLFEKIIDKADIKVAANILTNVISDVQKRESVDISKIRDEQLEEMFDLLAKGRITKDAVPQILKNLSKGKKIDASSFKAISDTEIRKVVKEIIAKEKTDKMGVIIGEAMKILKGKAEGKKLAEIVKEELKL